MARFEGIDFYDLDSLFTEEERMIRDTVRAFVEDRVMPIIGEAYIERKFPKQLIPELGELGVYGANLPEKYGCAGLNNVSYGLIMQELERGDSGIRSFVSVQGALVMYPIFAFGRPLAEQGVVQQQIAQSRNAIDQARLLCHLAAWTIDQHGNKSHAARQLLAQIKAVAPQLACHVIDRAKTGTAPWSERA